jgi:hypothetical protein
VSGKAATPDRSDVALKSRPLTAIWNVRPRFFGDKWGSRTPRQAVVPHRGEASHAPELDKSALTGYERFQSLRILPGIPRYDARSGPSPRWGIFSTSPGSQLDKVPRRPLLVSTTAHQNALPLFSLAQTDQELMWARVSR